VFAIDLNGDQYLATDAGVEEDAHGASVALDLLIKALKHVRRLHILVVKQRHPVICIS
jgi:hypothetical protein